MRAITLAIGSIAILYIPLSMLLEARGANDFIRPYHYCGLIVTVIVSVLLTVLLSRFWKTQSKWVHFLLSLVYIHLVIILWAFALPLGDHLAINKERENAPIEEGSETGYGWFYWDDSGMGGDPMSIFHFITLSLFDFVWMGMFLMFVIFTYLQGGISGRKNEAEQVAASDR